MGYVDDPAMVRVDFFKESGKWHTTVALKWDRYHSRENVGSDPEHSHPLMIREV